MFKLNSGDPDQTQQPHSAASDQGLHCLSMSHKMNTMVIYISNKKRNAPRRTVQLSGRLQVMCQFSLYRSKGMSGIAAIHTVDNQASKIC